ncbi:MAG: 4-vinyl reductase [Thermoplasmata archaeon]|jgi:predicted hydrocarbon binding protein|nr:4-vinyl reductase [Thermoplasmata archaeon]
MEQPERHIKLRKDELVEIKNLYETVMTFASHGMFYRTGRIVGNSLVKNAGTELTRVRDAMIKEGWATDINFDGDVITVTDSIEASSSDAPTCHMLRGVLAKLFEERTGKDVYCHERKCVSKGDESCVFVIDTEVL